jgi:hypothetical protein
MRVPSLSFAVYKNTNLNSIISVIAKLARARVRFPLKSINSSSKLNRIRFLKKIIKLRLVSNQATVSGKMKASDLYFFNC